MIWSLYPSDAFHEVRPKPESGRTITKFASSEPAAEIAKDEGEQETDGAWFNFARAFENFSFTPPAEWTRIGDSVVDYILPEWAQMLPLYLRKLQKELSSAPGSLAEGIWLEAHDPTVNPEIQYSAKVRVSNELCDEEKQFLARRKRIATLALAKYLGLEEKDIHEDDVPVIAMCGSGGGLRALVAGAGSMLAAADAGLFDCVTYTSGVSGSCWLQVLYHSSFAAGNVNRIVDHLKARLGVHITYPPTAFSSLVSAPTNKYLLSGIVEKLKGDPNATCGLVDIYGILLAARLLVPRGELGVSDRDFKLSNQRHSIKYGEHPMPIYTAVRHEIPILDAAAPKVVGSVPEDAKEEAKKEAWFQWFELTPYEFFCEEFSSGIPTFALGRRFKDGQDQPTEEGFYLPEVRTPLLLGIFGSAFCATLSHYYREVRPLVRSLTGLSAIDEMIHGRNEDLSKVHPIEPATIPNFTYQMKGKLALTTPTSIYDNEYIQLMDAGMSNNLPIYPLLRPGRDVDIIMAFDASSDVKTDNWLSVADGYARQRQVKGWPVGVGWPRKGESPKEAAKDLDESQATSTSDAEAKLTEAKRDQSARRIEAGVNEKVEEERRFDEGDETAGELGYCTVWVGSTAERSTEKPPPSKALDDTTHWQLMEPHAGIAVVYMPFLTNDKVGGVNPATSDYMSTWNFVYTPEQIDNVVALAKANFDEGKDKVRATVRAVYERKKKQRLDREKRLMTDRYRRLVRQDGDPFN